MSDATEEATHGQLVLSTHAYVLLQADEDTRVRWTLKGTVLESTQFLLEAAEPSDDAQSASAPRRMSSGGIFGGGAGARRPTVNFSEATREAAAGGGGGGEVSGGAIAGGGSCASCSKDGGRRHNRSAPGRGQRLCVAACFHAQAHARFRRIALAASSAVHRLHPSAALQMLAALPGAAAAAAKLVRAGGVASRRTRPRAPRRLQGRTGAARCSRPSPAANPPPRA